YKQYVSLNEEAEISPALRVFWGGCNFRCRFCDEAPRCFHPARGRCVEAEAFAEELASALKAFPEDASGTSFRRMRAAYRSIARAEARGSGGGNGKHPHAGVRMVSLLGGEPTLHVHTLLEVAAAAPVPLPLAINTNLYMTPEVLDLLEGVVWVYLADFKFGNDGCAERLAGVPRYMEVVTRNLRRIASATPIIVRHLLIPGHFECCFRPVAEWLSENLPGVRFQLYGGYVPCWRASEDERIGRFLRPAEVKRAETYAREAGLDVRVAGNGDAVPVAEVFGPPRPEGVEVSLTIGADGRLYAHDVTPAVAGLLQSLCRREEPAGQDEEKPMMPLGSQ
ncbi:MAG: radical SAM protein, partial [Planctomycetota bacterium]